jgi:hypothetical protein
MFRLLRFLVTGSWHTHQWDIITVHELYEHRGSEEHIVAFEYILQCKGCGNIKATKV